MKFVKIYTYIYFRKSEVFAQYFIPVVQSGF